MWEIFDKLCKEKGVSAYRVAQDTGVTTATLTNWKKGKYTPKREKMQTLADYFGVTVDYLMTGKEPSSDMFYSNENSDFMIEFTAKARNDKEFLERMMKYMELIKKGNTAVNEMIDFQYSKQQKEEN